MHADQLTITSPCPVELNEDLSNGEKRFFCGHCDKHVHVLSNMTQREAASFLATRKGQDTCVTYLHDAEGKVRFKTEPDIVPLARLRLPKRSVARRAAAAALALAACTPYAEGEPAQVDHHVDVQVAGGIEAMPIEPTVETPPPVERPPPVEYVAAGGIAEVEPLELEPLEPTPELELHPELVPPPVDKNDHELMPVAGGLRPNIEPVDVPTLTEEPCDKPAVEDEPCDAPVADAPSVDTPTIRKPTAKRGKIKRPSKLDVMRGGI